MGRAPHGRGGRPRLARARPCRSPRTAAGRRPPPRHGCARDARRDSALRPPGGGVGRGTAGRASRRHDRDGERQDAGVQPARARRDRARPEDARALPLPDEGARAGPGARALRDRRAGRPPGDLRRRHAGRAAKSDPNVGERDPHEPGHAPHRGPSPPRPLGRRAREPRVRRRRRGARVPRRVRIARRQRPAPPAAARAGLRRGAAVLARLGDDREPVGARPRADGTRDDRRLRRCGAAG